jgi:hypothetical protein
MRVKVPLTVLMLFLAGAGLICAALGLRFLASPFLDWPETSAYVVFPAGLILIVGGLIVSVAGLILAYWSVNCLRDLFSRPVTITGRASKRRKANANTLSVYYVTIGDQEFEVPESDFHKVTEGHEAALTYLPNTRTVETVMHVCPSWLSPTVIAIAQSIADRRDWSELPILADALEEAGYSDGEMLQRCREARDSKRIIEEILREIKRANQGKSV